MAVARIIRRLKRQALLERLIRQVHEEDERKEDPHFLFRLAGTGSSYLQQRRWNVPHYYGTQDTEKLFDEFRQQIAEFADSQAEEDEMIAQFTVMVMQAAFQYFHIALSEEELEQILPASS